MVEYKYIKLVGEKREWESIENRKIDLSQLGDSFHIVIEDKFNDAAAH